MKYIKNPVLRFVMIVLILSSAVILTACGSPKMVPDKTIEWAVEDYIKEHFSWLGLSPTYTYTVSHLPDSSTKSDTVHLDLSLTDPHFVGNTSYDATYIYDKSSGLWSVSRGGEWAPVTIDRYTNVSISKETVSQALSKNGFTLLESDFEVLSDDVLAANSLPSGGRVTSAWSNLGDKLSLISVVTDSADSAREAFSLVIDMEGLTSYSQHMDIKTKTGSNYEITQVDGMEEGTYVKGYLGYIDNGAFMFAASSEYDIGESFDKAMAEIGIFFE